MCENWQMPKNKAVTQILLFLFFIKKKKLLTKKLYQIYQFYTVSPLKIDFYLISVFVILVFITPAFFYFFFQTVKYLVSSV